MQIIHQTIPLYHKECILPMCNFEKLKFYKPRFDKKNRALCNLEYNDTELGESVDRRARCSNKCRSDWTCMAFQYYPPNKKCYFLKEEEPVIEADIPNFQCYIKIIPKPLGCTDLCEGFGSKTISDSNYDQSIINYANSSDPLFPIECWDTTQITTLDNAFLSTSLNVDLNCWDTSKVTSMKVSFHPQNKFSFIGL